MLRRISLFILVVSASLLIATLAMAQSGYNNQCCYDTVFSPCEYSCVQADVGGAIYVELPWVKTVGITTVKDCQPRGFGYESTNCTMGTDWWDKQQCATIKYWDSSNYDDCINDFGGTEAIAEVAACHDVDCN